MFKHIFRWSLVVATLAVLFLVVLKTKPQPVQSCCMTNGTVVTFMGATFGTNHIMIWGEPYQQSLYKILPVKFRSWSGASSCSFATANTNDPVFWLYETGVNPKAGANPNGNYPAMRVLDEYGCEYDPDGGSMGMNYTSHGGANGEETISHYQYDTHYPHGEIAGVCLYDSEAKTQRAAEFLIPGMTMASMPENSQPSSAPKQDGELTFQLASLVTGLKSEPCKYFALTNGGIFSQALFRMTKNGKADNSWSPVNIKATDSSGKAVRLGIHVLAHKDDAYVFNFEGYLDPSASPFQMRMEFMHQSDFSAEELVSFKKVPFPARAQSIELHLQAFAQGEQITLEQVSGPYTEQHYDSFGRPGEPFFEVIMQPSSNRVHLDMIGAVDEQGIKRGIISSPLGKGKYRFSFPAGGPAAKTMDLTFAVHKSRFIEFEATPVLFSTGTLVKKHD